MTGKTAKKSILVVEDESDQLAYLATLFKDHGYDVLTAQDGDEAMETVRRERPDLVTLDITMPMQSGVHFYRTLKDDEALASTPVVIVTAVTGWGGDPEGFKKFISGRKHTPAPEGFVAKPVDQEELLGIVAKLTNLEH